MTVRNLLDELIETHTCYGEKERGKRWAKEITGIKPDSGAYMFEGDFVAGGTIEVSPKEQIYLVHMRTGSAKYNYSQYQVIKMQADGELIHTGIKDDDDEKGWNLRIRDRVQVELDKITPDERKELIDVLISKLERMSFQELKQVTL